MGVLLAPLIAVAALGVAMAGLALQRRSQRRLVGRAVTTTGSSPDLLYFTGESCTVCHVAQRPALERLRRLASGVAIREVDVAREPEVARAYRVMTLPTTVVLTRDGTVAAVNVGFAGETQLHAQLLAAGAVHGAVAVG